MTWTCLEKKVNRYDPARPAIIAPVVKQWE
jgi:hypothetical protein